ncbi:MAG: hypothetical protein RL720_242 [Actinomycetota bacterium]|jgi:hypothetical protein
MSTPAPGQPRRVSPAVYRRRRLVALLALVAVVTAVVLIIVRPGQATPTPTETAAAVKPTVAPVATETATPTPTPTVDVTDYKECSTKNLEVLPVIDSVDYQAGVLPNLSLTIQNTGKTACFYNVGTSAQELTITSGAETYWVSTDCQTEKSDTIAILEPGVVYPSAPVSWSRERSAPDTCGGTRDAVPAGGASYYLTAKVGGVSSKSSAQFLLY